MGGADHPGADRLVANSTSASFGRWGNRVDSAGRDQLVPGVGRVAVVDHSAGRAVLLIDIDEIRRRRGSAVGTRNGLGAARRSVRLIFRETRRASTSSRSVS